MGKAACVNRCGAIVLWSWSHNVGTAHGVERRHHAAHPEDKIVWQGLIQRGMSGGNKE
jgi:hypothetical protein